MNHWIRSAGIVAALLLALHAAPGAGAAAPKPMAVWFYADWCTNCKLLAPKYAPARAGLEDKIQFVTLDLTNAQTKVQARDLAKSLGISPLYYANAATGWVALLNPAHDKVGELHQEQSTGEMRAALESLVAGTSAAPAPAASTH